MGVVGSRQLPGSSQCRACPWDAASASGLPSRATRNLGGPSAGGAAATSSGSTPGLSFEIQFPGRVSTSLTNAAARAERNNSRQCGTDRVAPPCLRPARKPAHVSASDHRRPGPAMRRLCRRQPVGAFGHDDSRQRGLIGCESRGWIAPARRPPQAHCRNRNAAADHHSIRTGCRAGPRMSFVPGLVRVGYRHNPAEAPTQRAWRGKVARMGSRRAVAGRCLGAARLIVAASQTSSATPNRGMQGCRVGARYRTRKAGWAAVSVQHRPSRRRSSRRRDRGGRRLAGDRPRLLPNSRYRSPC